MMGADPAEAVLVNLPDPIVIVRIVLKPRGVEGVESIVGELTPPGISNIHLSKSTRRRLPQRAARLVTMTDQPPLTYDEFAGEFAARAAVGAYNALYDRPAVLQVAGDVAGLRVLDLGCGPGLYAAELASRGATIVGIDESREMVRLAAERVPPPAQFRAHDLNQRIDWLEDESFDLAIMALVIHHLDNRRMVLSEAHRMLRPEGRLVVSTHHPTNDWDRLGGSYFDVERVSEIWQDKLGVEYWRQPLAATSDEFTAAGFLIEKIFEPRPSEELKERYPEDYDELLRLPAFIVFSLVKSTG